MIKKMFKGMNLCIFRKIEFLEQQCHVVFRVSRFYPVLV